MRIESLVYHVRPESFDELPVDWNRVFGRSAQLWVEIGFGNGEYLADMALKNQDVNFVGFELSITSFVKAQKRFHDLDLNNIRLVMVDGRFGLRELFHDDSVDRVVVNFPCPWSKKGYEDRRITAGDFVETLSVVLKKDGIFELATDDVGYAEEVREKLELSGYFDVEPLESDPVRVVQTRYERKWRSMGRKIYVVKAMKMKSGKVLRLIGGKVEDVHVRIESLDSGKFPELVNRVFKDGEKVFVVKGVFSSPDGKHYLVKVISTDRGFEQHYFVSVSERRDFWIVKLDSACQPYRTPAVKWSVREIAKQLSL